MAFAAHRRERFAPRKVRLRILATRQPGCLARLLVAELAGACVIERRGRAIGTAFARHAEFGDGAELAATRSVVELAAARPQLHRASEQVSLRVIDPLRRSETRRRVTALAGRGKLRTLLVRLRLAVAARDDEQCDQNAHAHA